MPPIKSVVQTLETGTATARREAVLALGYQRYDTSLVVPALIRALKDRDGSVRVLAAVTLTRFRTDPRVVEALANALSDPIPAVSDAAAGALDGLSLAAPEALTKVLLEGSEHGSRNAAALLSKLGPDAAPTVTAFTRALADPDARIRQRAAQGLKTVSSYAGSAIGALARTLTDTHAATRNSAAQAIQAISIEAAVSLRELESALETPASRLGATLALGIIATTRADPALRGTLPALRRHAARERNRELRKALQETLEAVERATAHLKDLPTPATASAASAASAASGIETLPLPAGPTKLPADTLPRPSASLNQPSTAPSPRVSWLSRLIRRP